MFFLNQRGLEWITAFFKTIHYYDRIFLAKKVVRFNVHNVVLF